MSVPSGPDLQPASRIASMLMDVLIRAGLVLALLSGSGLGYYYAAGVLAADPGVPDAPARAKNGPGPLLALPVPPEHEVMASLGALAQAILLSGASQLPDNRH